MRIKKLKTRSSMSILPYFRIYYTKQGFGIKQKYCPETNKTRRSGDSFQNGTVQNVPLVRSGTKPLLKAFRGFLLEWHSD